MEEWVNDYRSGIFNVLMAEKKRVIECHHMRNTQMNFLKFYLIWHHEELLTLAYDS